jgi:hypothetical protein
MINEPIVVWPPGTFYMDCSSYGSYYDCTYEYAQIASVGAIVCCPA